MKFVQDPVHFELPANYDNAMDNSLSDESSSAEQQQRDTDLKFAVYGLLRQWINMNDRRSLDQPNKRSAAFELLKATSHPGQSANVPVSSGQ